MELKQGWPDAFDDGPYQIRGRIHEKRNQTDERRGTRCHVYRSGYREIARAALVKIEPQRVGPQHCAHFRVTCARNAADLDSGAQFNSPSMLKYGLRPAGAIPKFRNNLPVPSRAPPARM